MNERSSQESRQFFPTLSKKIPVTTWPPPVKRLGRFCLLEERKQDLQKKQILLQKDRSVPTDNVSVVQESSSDGEAEKLFRGFGFLDNSIAIDEQGNN